MQTAESFDCLHAELDQLVNSFLEAKEREEKAKEERIALEKKITELTGVKSEGRFSVVTDNYKIIVDQKIYRKFEVTFSALKEALPAPVFAKICVPEPKLIVRALKKLDENDFRLVSRYLSCKPGKPWVGIYPAKAAKS